MKKIVYYFLIVLILIAGCKKNAGKKMAPNALKVVEYTVKKGNISKSLMQNGICQPKRVVTVMSKISGKIAKYLVEEGDFAKEKDQIVYIYPDINELQRVNQIKKNFVITKKDFSNTTTKYKSYKNQLKKGFVSQSEFDNVEKEYMNSKMAYENAKLEYDYLSDVKEIRYNGNLCYSISAPTSGTFYGKTVEEGEFIRSAMQNYTAGTILGYIGNIDDMEVVIDIDEVDYPYIKKGQECNITFDAFPEIRTTGNVDFISLNATQKDIFNQFIVKVKINKNPKGIIKPGIGANIDIIVLNVKDVPIIPMKAIKWNGANPFVTKKGKKEPTFIKTGKNDGKFTEIKEGLKEGDVIIYEQLPKIDYKNWRKK